MLTGSAGARDPSAPDVVVVVPARDEAERISACLLAVGEAVHEALAAGAVRRALVAVAAHRCGDRTAALARAALADSGLPYLVWETAAICSVGALRTALVDRAVRAAGWVPDWLFSTDADTIVRRRWLVDGLELAGSEHDLVAGLVDLDDLAADAPARRAHDALVAQGLRSGGGHDHVYAANLVIRYASFRAVGGFPDLPHGEEHGLVAAVRAAGGRVLASRELRVATSGRFHGRADFGLHAVLRRLADEAAGVEPETA